jgi:nitroreductase
MRTADPEHGDQSPGRDLAVTPAQACELLAYLATSAELCTREPMHYGMFRLIDASGRLATAMCENMPEDRSDWLRELRDSIDSNKELIMYDRPAFEEFVRQLVERMASGPLSARAPAETAGSATREQPEVTSRDDRPGEEPATTLAGLLETRRVVRSFTDEPVEERQLTQILLAGRRGTTAGNRKIQQFLVVDRPGQIRAVKTFAPGILGTPPVLIVVLIDLVAAGRYNVQVDRDETVWIDVGIAAMNMMIMAHALGLGSCPASSFSSRAVQLALSLPQPLRPAFMIQVGHPDHAALQAGRPTRGSPRSAVDRGSRTDIGDRSNSGSTRA